MGGPGADRVQPEPAQEAETIQHLRPLCQFSHALVVDLLVEIQPRLVAAQHVHLEAQAVQFDRHRAFERPRQHPVRFRQSFKLARGNFAALNYRPRREDRLQRRQNHRLPLVHAKRGNLHNQHVFVFIHDEAAQKIALRIHDAEGGRGRQVPLPDRQRCANAFLEERLVRLDPLRREARGR